MKFKKPIFDSKGYQTNLKSLNGTALPALDARTMGINAAMLRAAKAAVKMARAHGTKLYVMRNGKIVALDPWAESV